MRLLIIGSVGSGKTTLAKRLSDYFGIPYFSIDEIVHDIDNDSNRRSLEEQKELFNKINRENKDYILEGVIRHDLDFLFNISDKIIFLDYSKKVILRRVKVRYFKQKIGLEKCNYVVNKEMYNNMIKWASEFDSNDLIKRIGKNNKKLLIIRNNSELKKYFKYLDENKYDYAI